MSENQKNFLIWNFNADCLKSCIKYAAKSSAWGWLTHTLINQSCRHICYNLIHLVDLISCQYRWERVPRLIGSFEFSNFETDKSFKQELHTKFLPQSEHQSRSGSNNRGGRGQRSHLIEYMTCKWKRKQAGAELCQAQLIDWLIYYWSSISYK